LTRQRGDSADQRIEPTRAHASSAIELASMPKLQCIR
jgi:hypothetical protein